jgi:sucrose-6-phosphate hydrolase SacC (GH32 family)
MTNILNPLGVAPAWRDPFVFSDRTSGKFYVTISARCAGANDVYNGCVALAESENLIDWNVLPPLLAPQRYDEMETTQMVFHNGLYYLFFSTWGKDYAPDWAKTHGAHSGLHGYCSDRLLGDFQPVNGNDVVLDNGESMYTIRLVEKHDNGFTAIGWLNTDAQGKFIGRLSQPFTIIIDGDKRFIGKGDVGPPEAKSPEFV